jgi:hypothetical protein
LSRGPRISESKKLALAADLVAGKPLETVAASHNVTVGAIGRLKREDERFQAIFKELAEAFVEELQRRLRGLASTAVETLREICTLDHTMLPPGSGKALEQRRHASLNLLEWCRNLRIVGQEPVDPVELELEKLTNERLLKTLQQQKDQQRKKPGQPHYPDEIPLSFFRKPGEPDEDEESS